MQPEMTVYACAGTTKVAAPPVGHVWSTKGVGKGRGVAAAGEQDELPQVAGQVTDDPPWPTR